MAVNKITFVLLAGALASGGGAAYLTDSVISEKIHKHQEALDRQYKPVMVVVPSRSLRLGDILTYDNLSQREMPRGFLHADTILAENVSSVIGHSLVFPVNEGEAILTTHIAKKQGAGFSNLIKDGNRAITFPVDIVSSMSGLLRPGDRIDLLATLQDDNKTVTVPLLSNVSVLATGNLVDEQGAYNSDGNYQTITMVLAPEDAAKVTHAREVGKITVSLRSPDDAESRFNKRITLSTLMGEAKKSKNERKVEIIIGGKDAQ